VDTNVIFPEFLGPITVNYLLTSNLWHEIIDYEALEATLVILR